MFICGKKSLTFRAIGGSVLFLLAASQPAWRTCATQGSTEPKAVFLSPRLGRLHQEIQAGNRAAVESFWQEITKQGSPLVEPIVGDQRNLSVTFLWRDNKDTRVLISNDFSKSVHQMKLVRLLDTDVWYKSYRMGNDARFFYQFIVDDPNFPFVADDTTKYPTKFQPDPLNPRKYERFKPHVFSIVELPKAASLELAVRKADVPKGVVGQIVPNFKSALLNNERRIFLYRPPGFTTEGPPYPLIVMGSTYVSTVALPVVMDNLIARKAIRPAVALFIDYPDDATKNRELNCDPKYGDFLATELIPAMRGRLHATSDPGETIVGGASISGLSASCLAFQHPEVFGKILSQSGSYWWSPEGDSEDQWLTRQFAQRPKIPLEFYLSIGLLESEQAFRGGLISMVHANRHFRDVLRAKGYTVHYNEINAGHDPLNWQATLADGLQALVGMPKPPAKK